MDRETLKSQTLLQQEERKKAYQITQHGDEIEIDKLTLELVDNFKSAFDTEKLAIRYTPLLAQYDYIVGDISAEQLRLKGFYRNDKTVSNDDKIAALQDYLFEYVNFGAPYFVLGNVNPRPVEPEERSKSSKRTHRNSHKKTEKKRINGREKINKNKTVASSNKKTVKRPFVIKQK